MEPGGNQSISERIEEISGWHASAMEENCRHDKHEMCRGEDTHELHHEIEKFGCDEVEGSEGRQQNCVSAKRSPSSKE